MSKALSTNLKNLVLCFRQMLMNCFKYSCLIVNVLQGTNSILFCPCLEEELSLQCSTSQGSLTGLY